MSRDRHGTVEELVGVRIEPSGKRVILSNDWDEDHLSNHVRVDREDGDYYYASLDGWTQRYNSALGRAGLSLRQDRVEVRLGKFSGVLADGKSVESEAAIPLGQFVPPKRLPSWPTLSTSTPRLAPAVTVRRRPPGTT